MTIISETGNQYTNDEYGLRLLHEDETCRIYFSDRLQQHFIEYGVCDGISQLVNIDTHFVSGVKKTYGTKYQSPGVFIDRINKNLVYRIAKNGSSSLSMAFDGKVFSNIGESNFVSLESLDGENLDFQTYVKYFVVRDPVSRFCSSVAHCMRYDMREFSKFPKWLQDHMRSLEITRRKHAMINYLLNVLKILNAHYFLIERKYAVDEEVHVLPQSMHMMKILERHDADFCIRLEDLQDFIENTLGKKYSYESITGRNRGGISVDTLGDRITEVKSALEKDYDFLGEWQNRLVSI